MKNKSGEIKCKRCGAKMHMCFSEEWESWITYWKCPNCGRVKSNVSRICLEAAVLGALLIGVCILFVWLLSFVFD